MEFLRKTLQTDFSVFAVPKMFVNQRLLTGKGAQGYIRTGKDSQKTVTNMQKTCKYRKTTKRRATKQEKQSKTGKICAGCSCSDNQ